MSRTLFGVSALGELIVGLAAVAFPQTVLGFLLKAPVVDAAVVIARMLGITLAALGLTWWFASNDRHGLGRCTAGFLAYNLGIGLLFLLLALDSPRVPVLWVVASLHLLAGLGSGVPVLVRSPESGTESS